MTSAQTVSAGTSLLDRIASTYSKSDDAFCDPYKSVIVLIARPKVGKSTFIGSSKHVLRIDVDRAGPVVESKCLSIPFREHPPIDWDWVEARIDEICSAKKQNKLGDIRTIAIDTLPVLIGMLTEKIAQEEGKDFEEIDGRRAWNLVYGRIMRMIYKIKNAGLGLILVIHLIEKKKPMGENALVIKEDINIPDGCWGRIHPIADFTVQLDRVDEPVMKDVTLPNGGIKQVRSGKTAPKWYLRMKVDPSSELHRILGARVRGTPPDFFELPEIKDGINSETPFEVFAKAIAELNKTQS